MSHVTVLACPRSTSILNIIYHFKITERKWPSKAAVFHWLSDEEIPIVKILKHVDNDDSVG